MPEACLVGRLAEQAAEPSKSRTEPSASAKRDGDDPHTCMSETA